ncbi:uncharacterized protein LOC105696546 isoform X2 [Orussus abietinus]|uniref:uncharacterized protein LOC105696546 isoform X2 n=1 Tax=Orussus abietinus TaxID=222816 RepID=UPI0006254490|nr:uncharacterized protein LOC105696546 isoform X2 [Orussus abietinus]
MLPIRCRGCLTNLENENNGKDIFKDDLAIDTVNLEDQSQSTLNLNKRIKLDSCIELITGKEITETDNLPRVLCATCLKKLEACIQFRFQLLTSLEILITSVSHDDAFNPTLACDVNDDSSLASKAFDAEIKGKSQEKGTDVLQSKNGLKFKIMTSNLRSMYVLEKMMKYWN